MQDKFIIIVTYFTISNKIIPNKIFRMKFVLNQKEILRNSRETV